MTTGFDREDVRFPAGDVTCDAWLYRPQGVENPPVVVLGHGLGATREMRIGPYAERFAQAGFAALAFTHRNFGTSGGTPRKVVSLQQQQEDWEAALAFVRSLDGVDSSRIAVWGSSLGGGNAITVASRHPELAAVVVQCPFTDGVASARALGPVSLAKLGPAIAKDLLAGALGREPVLVDLAGPKYSKALMATPDALPGALSLIGPDETLDNVAAARIAAEMLFTSPGRLVDRLTVPILFCLCEQDTIAPADRTYKYAATAPRGEIRSYPTTHFGIYTGEQFEHAVADQTDFLVRHVHPGDAGAGDTARQDTDRS